jgi:hypothetical protein
MDKQRKQSYTQDEMLSNYKLTKSAVIIQNKYRDRKKKCKDINNHMNYLYCLIYSLMAHLNEQYDTNIIEKDNYNNLMEEIKKALDIYKTVPNTPITVGELQNYNPNSILTQITYIKDQIFNLISQIGAKRCTDIINILTNKTFDWGILSQKYREKLSFYNNFFICLSCTVIDKPISIYKILKSSELTELPEDPFIIDRTIPDSNSIIEKLEAATLLIPIIPEFGKIYSANYMSSNKTSKAEFKTDKDKEFMDEISNSGLKFISIDGYFKKDPLNMSHYIGEFGVKNDQILKEMEYLEIQNSFKNDFYAQISIKDFLLKDIGSIVELIQDNYNELQSMKRRQLSTNVNNFLKSNPEKQRNTLILYLLSSNNDDNLFANVIYDMIVNNSYLLRQQPMSEYIYRSMHWTVQNKFKIAHKNAENYTQKIQSMQNTNIDYEKRIALLKASDEIKNKAFDKMKEMNGSKESSVKAENYLNGLLKIPFGVQHIEPIMMFTENFKDEILDTINYVVKIKENEEWLINEPIVDDIDNYVKNYYENFYGKFDAIMTFDDFVEETHKLLVKLSKYFEQNDDYGIQISDDEINNAIEEATAEATAEINIDGATESKNVDNVEEEVKDSLVDFDADDKIPFQKSKSMNSDDFEAELKKRIEESNSELPPKETVIECISKLQKIKSITDILMEHDNTTESLVDYMDRELEEMSDSFQNDYNLSFSGCNPEGNEIVDELDYRGDIWVNIYNKLLNIEVKWAKFKVKRTRYVQRAEKILDECVYGMDNAKNAFIQLLAQWINGKMKGACIGIHGEAGIGKTTLCKNGFSKCLIDDEGTCRPFGFLPLGGTSNGATLIGHNYTFLGSTWGRIVDIMMQHNCMNPIIYIDEADKISNTDYGKEVGDIMTHMTDPTQNTEFFDKYFSGVPIDLSNVLFIFSYNDPTKLDPILRNRIFEIPISSPSPLDKVVICQNWLIPEIIVDVGFKRNELEISDEMLRHIIESYASTDTGVRKIKEIIFQIYRQLNLEKIKDSNIDNTIVTHQWIRTLLKDRTEDNTSCQHMYT